MSEPRTLSQTLKENHLTQWSHRSMTTATAEARPNIAFTKSTTAKLD
jgi:hypothetical protein